MSLVRDRRNQSLRRSIRRSRGPIVLVATLVTAMFAPACSIGPETVMRDRFNYGEALARSQREEILQNLVRLRYLESPIFLTISTVVNQYSLEGNVDAGFGWVFGAGAATTSSMGGGGKYYDRPTITYAPMSGEQFVDSYLKPIPQQSLLTLVQSGYQIDFLFPLMLRSINGHVNANHMARKDRFADPEFTRIVELMTTLQLAGDLRVRAIPSDPQAETPRCFLEWSTPDDPSQRDALDELMGLLGIKEKAGRAEVVFGEPVEGKIALITRSAMAILVDVSSYVDVPADDVARGVVRRGMPSDAATRAPLFVHSSLREPEDPYVAVKHRGMWFWIDETDVESKACFFALVILSNIAERTSDSDGPVLTIPAG